MDNLSFLITGGAGFIGSHIVEYLLLNNAKKVRILDNLSTGFKKNIDPYLQKYSNLEFIYGDIRDFHTCITVCKNIDIICHQAALGSVPRSINDPINSHHVNVNGFLNILIAAKENNIKRVVYASSSSVYGTNTNKIKIENQIGVPLSPYAVTKCINELYANIFFRMYGLECIGLRYFNVFGPRQNPYGDYAAVIPKFINLLDTNNNITIYGDGSFSRDFTYIDNVVNANILALLTTNSECYGEVFNVGTNNSTTINDLATLLINIMNKQKCQIIYAPIRLGDVVSSNASIEKSSKMLNYKPIIDFETGIIKTVEYFMKNK